MQYLSDLYWEKFKTSSSKLSFKFDGVKFEKLVNELLQILYGKKWVQTKKTHDNNRDFWIIINNKKFWAECKNYRDSIAMSTLAPTLVMAQIYEVNTILFFSRSPINSKAKEKILAYGEKTEKQIIFYDAENLENLIIKNTEYLSRKFRPQKKTIKSGYFLSDYISMYYFQNATLNSIVADEEFLNYKLLKKIRYNEVFALSIIIRNPYPDKNVEIKISFADINPDKYKFQYLHKNIFPEKKECFSFRLEPGEGKSISINLRPIIFYPRLNMPNFQLEVWYNNQKKLEWFSPKKIVKCTWIGQSKLIGSQYDRIIKKVSDELVLNTKFSCLLLTGTSGTGKTRMLSETTNIFLQYGYKILNLTSANQFASHYLIKEIIYFIYEIPKSLVLSILESKLEENYYTQKNEKPQTDINKVMKLIELINTKQDEKELCQFIDLYGEIIFEKLSIEKYVIVIDNVQYSAEAFQYFMYQYINYSINQNRINYSILACAFNHDYMTDIASDLLFHLLHLNIPNLLHYDLKGFSDVGQGILFLRELIGTSEEMYDDFFKELINTVSLKPYNLYQVVHLMEEENIIKITDDNRGYLFVDDKAWDALLKLHNDITDVLNTRWNFLINIIDKFIVYRIFSVLYLFDRIDEKIMNIFHLKYSILNFICNKHFIRKSTENYFEFDHDIIRNYFEIEHNDKILSCLKWLKEKNIFHSLTNYQVQNDMFFMFILKSKHYILKISKNINYLKIPKRISTVYYKELFYNCLDIMELYSFSEWIYIMQQICVIIRKINGSLNAMLYYKCVYNKILTKFYDFSTLYSYDFRQFIHSYCDILVELHKREDAELLITDVLNKSKKEISENNEASDERYVLRSIMYNRWYICYNNAILTEEVKQLRKNYMNKSRENIPFIHDAHKRALIEFLNNSDEGYNYYGYRTDKKHLLNIWKNCIQNIPQIVPEKTMNYFRKIVQHDLINMDYQNTLDHIAQGRKYLNEGEYSHEPLIFNTFFIMAEIMANLQFFPKEKHFYTNKLINDLIKIQNLLDNGKMGDILLLKGVDAYYSHNEKDMYYSFKQALEDYGKKKTSRFWIKEKLLLENIQRSFTELDLYTKNYDISFLPTDFRIPLTKEQLLNLHASGIQQTPDGKMNLPLI